LQKIKAFILTDMIGDRDLDIQHDTNSTPAMVNVIRRAAAIEGDSQYFFKTEIGVDDDHIPFVERGVPSVDVIDLDYGPNDSYHHTAQDTLDKLSAHSLMVSGSVIEEAMRLINADAAGDAAKRR
jgi:glutaminyl-peptide cyclotransferase